jgi:hypothetical protein
MRYRAALATILTTSTLVLGGCASAPVIDMDEPRRVVGTENDVRVDAEITGDRLNGSITLPLRYEITNLRSAPIAVADIVPDTTYDDETQTVTIGVGSEVPGNNLLPRLIRIGPGEKKSFNTSARVRLLMPPPGSPNVRYPNALRIKVNFLGGDLTPFEKLLAMTEKALADAQLADAMFSTWVERTEVVYTNAVPMKWGDFTPAQQQQPPGRKRINGKK